MLSQEPPKQKSEALPKYQPAGKNSLEHYQSTNLMNASLNHYHIPNG